MKYLKHISYFLFLFLWHDAINSHAQIQQIKFNLVEGINGISLGKINAITQDPNGFMWFADQNNASLIRYDGYKMVSYRNDPFNDNSLGAAYPETLFADSAGIIWIGLLGMGLDRFDPETGNFTHYRHRPNDRSSLSNDTVNTILMDHEGILWVGTTGGLNRFDHKSGTFTRYQHDPKNINSLSNNCIRSIYEDRKGTIWIGTGFAWDNNNEGGLNRFDRKTGTFTRYKNDPKNPHSLIDNKIRAVYEDSGGNFWIGTRKNGLHKMNRETGTFKTYPYNPAMPEQLSSPAFKTDNKFDHISFITEDAKGALWIGTIYSGINRYDTLTKKMAHSSNYRTNGFTDSSGWCAYTSREGVLWLSTQENNLFRINPSHISIPDHAEQGHAQCFYEESGILWIGTSFGLLAKDRNTGEIIQRFVNDPMNPSTISHDGIISIVKGKGLLWMGTTAGGLNSFDPVKKTFISYKHVPGNNHSISSNNISRLYADRNGSLWIGTWQDGLDYMDPVTGIFTNYRYDPKDTGSLSQNTVSAIRQDKKNRLWVGTGNRGLNLMDPAAGKFEHYLHRLKIYCIYEDSNGIIWTGTDENLYRFDESSNNFIPFADPQGGMPFASVISILGDDNNNLWLATAQGIIKINRDRDQSIFYGKNQGVHEGGFYFDKGYKGSQNELFFGHVSGYYAFSPDKLTTELKAPKLILTDFRVGGKPAKPGPGSPFNGSLMEAEEIRLTYKQDIFSFDFAAIDYRNPEDNRHLFILENYDNEWRSAGTEQRASYFNVPPGRYIFRVKAASSDGVWAEKAIKIIIAPAWWNTWWFRITAGLLIVMAFYGIIRWRLHQKFRRQLERSEKETQLAELKHKTSELEMQALRAQMNPHFIFNSLNSINRFILQNNKAQASEYLTKFSRLIRMILQNSQASLINLENELETLKLYLDLEALRFEDRFEYKISVDDELDTDIIKVPPLIIQPYVENAIWHGLMHKEEKGQLEITITQENDHLIFKITDDGVGRKKAALFTNEKDGRHKSMGLKITADRIDILQRLNGNGSNVTINDMVHPNGSAAGTEVVIKMPLIGV